MDWQSAIIVVLAILVIGVFFAGELYYSNHMATVPAVRWVQRDTGTWTLMDAYRSCCHVFGRPVDLKPEAHGAAVWNALMSRSMMARFMVQDRLLLREEPYPHHVWISCTYTIPCGELELEPPATFSWGQISAKQGRMYVIIEAPCLEFIWALNATIMEAISTCAAYDVGFLERFNSLREKFLKREAKARTELTYSQALEEIMMRGAVGKLKDV